MTGSGYSWAIPGSPLCPGPERLDRLRDAKGHEVVVGSPDNLNSNRQVTVSHAGGKRSTTGQRLNMLNMAVIAVSVSVTSWAVYRQKYPFASFSAGTSGQETPGVISASYCLNNGPRWSFQTCPATSRLFR